MYWENRGNHGYSYMNAFIDYTGAISQSLMKSYFAWPSCVYLIKNQIKKYSYIKYWRMIMENISQSRGSFIPNDFNKVGLHAAM